MVERFASRLKRQARLESKASRHADGGALGPALGPQPQALDAAPQSRPHAQIVDFDPFVA
jgi:hypothetical protein